MKKSIITLIFVFTLVIISVPALAGDKWNVLDTSMEIAWQAANAADYLQTRTIAKNPDDFCEYNPILGKHPDEDTVDIYFAAAAVLHLGVSILLPTKYRTLWQGITLGCTITCVQINYRAGIKIDF